jgi:signal transduction histidine kinase
MTDQLVERNQEISKLYVAQLEETARRDAVLASITDAVIVLDMQGRSILANRAAHDLNAMLKDDAGARRVFQGLLAKAQTLTIPRLVSLMDRHFNVLATPVTLEDGGLLGYVIVFYDISDLIEAQRLKDELILQLSHELRTPLTAVHGYVSMVQVYGGMNGDSADLVDKAMEQVNLLSGMLNHVIEVSAILADQLEIDHERFDVNQIVIDTVEEHRAAIDRAGMRLNLVAFREQICIDGDPIRIGEAVAHILTNAYYYTLPGGSIEVSVEHTGLEVEIAIVDTGVGIAPEEQEKVFERMYRGKSADAGPTDARGLGLGLFLARAIVEAHGGRIDLESQVNAGTVVMMILPVRPHERQS